ncbi:hypothetical protein [Microvirga thermotolerans]|uniref:Uncharacterized protein n=1 Tax=Microvirga thermotolerans TaxID=2651334 RepID=A0A5P9K108_9HYPH|nr:hypothetical protein [Microvirga thermotolerans]QFU15914.1 hypothetical protein GDR74_06595 [Microvirga thermotolerans]
MRHLPAIAIGTVGSAFLALSLLSDGATGKIAPVPAPAASAVRDAGPAPLVIEAIDGRILFGPDSIANTNYLDGVARPVATLKEERRSPPQEPASQQHETRDEPQKKKRPQTFGCVTSVSPLARASAEQSPSLCLAWNEDGRILG